MTTAQIQEVLEKTAKALAAFKVTYTQWILKARIAIKQAYTQNKMTKLQLVGQLERVEEQLVEQQKYQRGRRILNPKNMGMPQIRK